MKKCIIYSIIIYLIIYMAIMCKKPSILYTENNNIKSWSYLKDRIKYGYNDYTELLCYPSIMIFVVIFSFLLAKNLSLEN